MEKRELGQSGIKVSPLALGSNVFGWTIDEKKSFEVLDAYVAHGLDFIDTADVYANWVPGNKGGESETIIGNWLQKSGKRHKVIIATKVGAPMTPDQKGLSKSYITKAVEDSLRRLKTDYIDLYQSHLDDKETPLEETLSTYTDLIKQGKVRAIGASNIEAARFKEALEVSKKNGFAAYQTLQPEYNLYDRIGYEKDLELLCIENNIGVITYYSLASGFLTGKYRSKEDLDKSQRGQGIQKYLNDRGLSILKALDEVASKYDSTPTSVAIAWVAARPGITAPISSATNTTQLQDIVAGTQLNLDKNAIDLLNNASNY